MFRKVIVAMTMLVSLFASNSVLAAERATLSVAGVVCSFCAQGIRKSFIKTNAVESVEVDLDKHQVTLVFRSDKSLSDEEIRKTLEAAGYNLIGISREADKQLNNLPQT